MILWLSVAHALSGQVTGPDGSGLAEVSVLAYDVRRQYVLVTTDSEGHFDFGPLDGAHWRVRVLAPTGLSLQEQWVGGEGSCGAEAFAGTASLDPVVLQPGARLVGELQVGGAPLGGAQLLSWVEEREMLALTGTTSEQGRFEVAGLPETGEAWLRIESERVPDQWLGPALEALDADRVVLDGADVVDLGQNEVLEGVTVRGAVMGPEGPASSGVVKAYSPSQIRSVAIGADGSFEVTGLPPGDVLLWAESDGVATTYYPDAAEPDERIPVSAHGDVVEGVSISAPAAARLRGRLTGLDDPEGAALFLFNASGTVAVGAYADAEGVFTFRGLHAGTYTLQFFAPHQGGVIDFFRDDEGELVGLEVAAARESDLGPVAMPLGARVVGVVRDETTLAPVYGATVSAEEAGTGMRMLVQTQRDGSYVLPGLGEGLWRLSVEHSALCVGEPHSVTVYYPDGIDPSWGGVVELEAGQQWAWDPVVPADLDQDEMSDAWETAHGLDPTVDDAAEDPDGDGFTNLEEYRLGTDPTTTAQATGCGCRAVPAGGSPVLGGWLFAAVLATLRRKGVQPL